MGENIRREQNVRHHVKSRGSDTQMHDNIFYRIVSRKQHDEDVKLPNSVLTVQNLHIILEAMLALWHLEHHVYRCIWTAQRYDIVIHVV
jgi:hypothetical protein